MTFFILISHILYINLGQYVCFTVQCSHINPLTLLQKKIIRFITNSRFDDHTLPLFKETKILRIIEVHKFLLGSYAFKKNRQGAFNYPSYPIITRGSNNAIPVYQRIDLTQRSLLYSAPSLLNTIPDHIRACNKISMFKMLYRDYLLQNMVPDVI